MPDDSFFPSEPKFHARIPGILLSACLVLMGAATLFGQGGPTVVGAGYRNPSAINVAPGQIVTLSLTGVKTVRKLQWSIGFDVGERYRLLLDFCRRAGFDDETRWMERRIQIIGTRDRSGL